MKYVLIFLCIGLFCYAAPSPIPKSFKIDKLEANDIIVNNSISIKNEDSSVFIDAKNVIVSNKNGQNIHLFSGNSETSISIRSDSSTPFTIFLDREGTPCLQIPTKNGIKFIGVSELTKK